MKEDSENSQKIHGCSEWSTESVNECTRQSDTLTLVKGPRTRELIPLQFTLQLHDAKSEKFPENSWVFRMVPVVRERVHAGIGHSDASQKGLGCLSSCLDRLSHERAIRGYAPTIGWPGHAGPASKLTRVLGPFLLLL